MSSYQSNIDLPAAARLVAAARRIAVTTHAKPDGDAFGAVIALTAALRARGQNAEAWFMPPVPASFRGLRGHELGQLTQGDRFTDDADLVIVLDTGAWAQLSPLRARLEKSLDRTLILDHHLSGDVPAKWVYVDGAAAACCEVVGQFIDALHALPGAAQVQGDPLANPTVRDALFVGLAADTGWFRFSNTRPATHELAARLLHHGLDHAEIYEKLEQTERPEKLALMIRALGSLKLLAGGSVAIMTLRAADFTETGALAEETERFVDLPQAVASVRLVVLLTEPPEANRGTARTDGQGTLPGTGSIRVSFRSKPGPRAVNVAALAAGFGGGGHARAAAAKVAGSVEQVFERVAAVVTAAANQP